MRKSRKTKSIKRKLSRKSYKSRKTQRGGVDWSAVRSTYGSTVKSAGTQLKKGKAVVGNVATKGASSVKKGTAAFSKPAKTGIKPINSPPTTAINRQQKINESNRKRLELDKQRSAMSNADYAKSLKGTPKVSQSVANVNKMPTQKWSKAEKKKKI
jgi:hypothetical protein